MTVSWNKSPRGIVIALLVTIAYVVTLHDSLNVQTINKPLIISD